jgi:maltooligosyltrehalose trehalohydrolase
MVCLYGGGNWKHGGRRALQDPVWNFRHGPRQQAAGECRFQLWAPAAKRVDLHVISPEDRLLPMEPHPRGYFRAATRAAGAGSLYRYVLDGTKERPDPASRSQPEGVHGASQVVDPRFDWHDEAWRGLPFEACVFYELHTATYTKEGTFQAIIPHLADLRELGVTIIELMPVAQFPGTRNWGYDGVFPFAAQDSYGGTAGLKTLVDACHAQGLGVALDVVYNHLGPEGNYLADFGPYFTTRYQTPWGPALNFDGAGSSEVRRFFIENALYWVTEFHMDALRLDAIHAIFDQTARSFLEELGEAVHRAGRRLRRRIHVIPESDLGDPRVVRPTSRGGIGLDALWNDDFHHALHTVLTGERSGYYSDFGKFGQLAKACRNGFVYTGQYSRFRQRRHGTPASVLAGRRQVVFAQNHDQVGNRMLGERLSQLVDFESLRLAAATVLLSPFLPLLFMGEEYGETAPFLYFTSHGDPALVEAVRKGRKEEFAAFAWQGEPPDPHDPHTLERSRLNHGLKNEGCHRALYQFYRELLRLRRSTGCLAHPSRGHTEVKAFYGDRALAIRRWREREEAVVLLAFGTRITAPRLFFAAGRWRKALDSAAPAWMGPGSATPAELDGGSVALDLPPRSATVYLREQAP